MSKRRPLSPDAKAAAIARLNEAMRKACERMERRDQIEDAEALTGILAVLDEHPRDE